METSSALKKLDRCCNGPPGTLPPSRCGAGHSLGFPAGPMACPMCDRWHYKDSEGEHLVTSYWQSCRNVRGQLLGEWSLVQPLQECLRPAHLWEVMFRLGPDVFLRKKNFNRPRHLPYTKNEQTKKWVCNKKGQVMWTVLFRNGFTT